MMDGYFKWGKIWKDVFFNMKNIPNLIENNSVNLNVEVIQFDKITI